MLTSTLGEAAGLLRIKLLREPEAAALAYGLTQRFVLIVREDDVIEIYGEEDMREEQKGRAELSIRVEAQERR